MTDLFVESQIDRLEQQLKAVASLLLEDQSSDFSAGCEVLQRQSVELAQAFDAMAHRALRHRTVQRLRELSQTIAYLRENMLRQAAYVDHAVALLVPSPAQATYAGATSPYGAVARQTGTFKVLAA